MTSAERWQVRCTTMGWNLEGTGGGCTALVNRDIPGVTFYATTQGDPSAPELRDVDPTCIGMYSENDVLVGKLLCDVDPMALAHVTAREWMHRLLQHAITL